MRFDLSFPDNSEFDNRLYGLIGRIVVTFNSLEAVLRECIARSLGAPTDLGPVLLCRVAFSDLVDMFKITACFASRSWPDSADFEVRVCQLAKDLKAANDQRNRAVHSAYRDAVQITDAGGKLCTERVTERIKFRRELNYALDPTLAAELVASLDDLEAVLAQIKSAYSDLSLLSVHLIPPGRDRSESKVE
jgi:hypothetical protein